MRILSAAQHRALDQATLAAHGIDELQLMERAASAWTAAFTHRYRNKDRPITVLVGPGNNGGDGLVIARLLRLETYTVSVLLLDIAPASPANTTNRKRAKDVGVPLRTIMSDDDLPTLSHDTLVIDAVFGTGMSRPIEGYWARCIEHFNALPVHRVAVDLPSGLRTDEPSTGAVFRAHFTLSLGYPKLALFAPANTPFLGKWQLVSFALAEPPTTPEETPNRLLTEPEVASLLRLRSANDHKGTFGHALLVAGAFGKMGAAVICARAVLRAGAGLVTTHIPRSGYEIMQISFPEAMCSVDAHRYHFTGLAALDGYATVAIGPGLGKEPTTATAFSQLLADYSKPMVIDADALNLLAEHPEQLANVPKGSILTPHPKEFERLFGHQADDFARWQVQGEVAGRYGLVVLLKMGYTSIATPDGRLYFNPTGNPGMGTGGTGDALTGILTGLLAQGYDPEDAARLGVYLHGLAGDLAAEELEQESLLAEDVVSHLGKAFKRLHTVRDAAR